MPILVTTVDIGNGQSDSIEVREGDDPVALAHSFVEKHGLPPGLAEALARHLWENLNEAIAAARREMQECNLGCCYEGDYVGEMDGSAQRSLKVRGRSPVAAGDKPCGVVIWAGLPNHHPEG